MCRGNVQRPLPVQKHSGERESHSGATAKTVRLPVGITVRLPVGITVRLHPGITVRLHPGIAFAFTPESFSSSPGIRTVRCAGQFWRLQKTWAVGYIKRVPVNCAPIAQMDRVSGYEPEGRVFESPWAHHPHPLHDLQFFKNWECAGTRKRSRPAVRALACVVNVRTQPRNWRFGARTPTNTAQLIDPLPSLASLATVGPGGCSSRLRMLGDFWTRQQGQGAGSRRCQQAGLDIYH